MRGEEGSADHAADQVEATLRQAVKPGGMLRKFLESQLAQKKRPLYHKVVHNSWKVAPNCGPLAFQTNSNHHSSDICHIVAFLNYGILI